MDDGLKNRAYLEGQKLERAGYDREVILARLDKMDIPEELANQVVNNLTIQQHVRVQKENEPFYNIALFRIGVGAGLAIIAYLIVLGLIILPIGLIGGGIATAYMVKSKGL